ncbi:permease [Paenibacillus lentus]|uniref:Permease n=1 Tax=Paenibacillus lentus TaxID=1338368 RepID=A0A3S8RZA4_9BACL|nr:permease [Paenibacillus lentus]AZK48261.1 permease [Paenibacillus lentus]
MNPITQSRWLSLLLPAAFVLACLIVVVPSLLALPIIDLNYIHLFKTSFIGILLEALPFVIIGALLSSLVHLYISENTLSKWIPKNPVTGILFACTLGLIFPVCECGMIPLIRKLIQKGMPVYIAAVFILAGPIVNPVVYGATYMAFRLHPEMVYARMGLAFLVAAVVGWMVYATWNANPLRDRSLSPPAAHKHNCKHNHGHDLQHDNNHKHNHNHNHQEPHQQHTLLHNPTPDTHHHEHSRQGGRVTSIFVHAADEVFDMGKYLIMGCLITAAIQSFIPRESLIAIGGGPVSSYVFMMGFAFLLSLCSTSDAFVASAFTHTFSSGSLLAFLVFGPMLDLKNVLMLLSVFRIKFVLYFAFLICTVVFIGSVIVGKLYLS